MDTGIQPVQLIKPHFTIEYFPKSGPDPVAVYSKPPEQSVSQEQVSHERRHAREDDGKNVIGLTPQVLTDGKIHGRSHDQAQEQADGDPNLRLRTRPWRVGM